MVSTQLVLLWMEGVWARGRRRIEAGGTTEGQSDPRNTLQGPEELAEGN